LRSYDEHLTIGDPRCPHALDPRVAKKVYCSVTVDGVPVSVGLISNGTSKLALVPWSFFDFRQVAASLSPAWIRSAVAAHATGERTIVDGPTLALCSYGSLKRP